MATRTHLDLIVARRTADGDNCFHRHACADQHRHFCPNGEADGHAEAWRWKDSWVLKFISYNQSTPTKDRDLVQFQETVGRK